VRPARRAPKVTVTREGASLCQKGCYPVAFVLVNYSLLQHPTLAVNPPRTPPAPVAVERSCEARQRLTA
jgi:hypothetical protein